MLKSLKENKTLIFLSAAIISLFLFIQLRIDQYLQYNVFGQETLARLQELLTLFLSVVVEAFPFIILGTLISVLVELFVKSEWIFKVLPKNKILAGFVISILGMFMPVCECGNVPVARRLLAKNFTVSQSVIFLLAAPIINPITIWATLEAFSPDPSFMIIRVAAALVISNLAGYIISFKKDQTQLLNEKFVHDYCEIHEHDHKHSKLEEGLTIFKTEFWEVTKLLCLGAFIAALTQIFIPREVITSIGQSPVLSIVAMMIFAFVISICSNVDAFVALPYVSTFSVGSIIAFLVFGPMIDMKIITMLKTSFKLKLIIFLVVFVALASFLTGLIVNLVI